MLDWNPSRCNFHFILQDINLYRRDLVQGGLIRSICWCDFYQSRTLDVRTIQFKLCCPVPIAEVLPYRTGFTTVFDLFFTLISKPVKTELYSVWDRATYIVGHFPTYTVQAIQLESLKNGLLLDFLSSCLLCQHRSKTWLGLLTPKISIIYRSNIFK